MLTGGRLRGAAADVPLGVAAFGPDGTVEGEALMMLALLRRTQQISRKGQVRGWLQCKVEETISAEVDGDVEASSDVD